MVQDNATKLAIAVVILLAIVAGVLLVRGGQYQFPDRERPGQYGWTGECCTCSRAMMNIKGDVLAQTQEVLFRNEHVPDCAAACAQQHEYTKRSYTKYQVTSFVSNDAECRTSLPTPRTSGWAGGYPDQPVDSGYYISS